MRRLVIQVILIIIIGVVSGCSKKIILEKINSRESILVRLNRENKVITLIEFPFNLRIENKYYTKQKIGRIIYEYGSKEDGVGLLLFDGKKEVSNYNPKKVLAFDDILFTAYTGHYLNCNEFVQNQLKPYVNKMLELNQDTLHVGTVEQFKQKHAELFKMLTENDTISIRYLKNKNSGLGERIAIPANW